MSKSKFKIPKRDMNWRLLNRFIVLDALSQHGLLNTKQMVDPDDYVNWTSVEAALDCYGTNNKN